MHKGMTGDLTAGIGSGVATLPLIVAIASIAFGSLGPQTAAAMAAVVFATSLVGGTLVALLARCPVLVGIPSGSSALVLAGLFGAMAAGGKTPGIAEVMAISMAVAVVVALVQLALVKAGAASLGPLAPYPVVAGLVNGTAVLVLLSQVPPLVAHRAEIIVALATAAVMLRFPPRWKIPPVLPAVAMGMAVHRALDLSGVDAGPMLSAMPSPLAFPGMAIDAYVALGTELTALPWGAILTAGVTIALLGVLDTLATFSALSDMGVATDERRDLAVVGLSNIAVAAAAGGPPVSAPVAGALGLLRTGATGRAAPIARLVTLGLGGVFLGNSLPLVPQGAVVGLVLAIGLRLLDPEPLRLLWRAIRGGGPHRVEIAGSALISLAVVAVAVFAGLAVAVAIGAIACLLVFTAAMAGSAVRRVYDGAAALSRVRRSAEETSVLLRERHAVAVLELAGPLFFGNVSPLGRALDQVQETGARHVVVDISQIVNVDLSGARRLMSIIRQRRARGMQVVLAPVCPGHPVADYLDALGMPAGACFAELTAALAAAEAATLEEAGVEPVAYATADAALCALGVAPAHAATLALRAETRDLAAGEVLCQAGEPADAIFVLMQGQVDVVLARSAGEPAGGRVVLAHLRAGAVIGERALFEAGTRSADVVCAVASRVMILSGPTLAALLAEASPAALALVVAISRNTAISLQQANAAIQRLQV